MSNVGTGSAPPPYESVNFAMQEIPIDGAHAPISYSYQNSDLNFPVVLMTFLRWVGIVINSERRLIFLIVMFLFNIYFAYTLDVSAGLLVLHFFHNDKTQFYWLTFLSYLFIISTYYTLLYKRKNVTDVLTQLNKIACHERTMLVNILTCLFCTVNFLFVFASIIIYFVQTNIYLIKLHVLIITVFLSCFIYQTFLNMFVLMYILLCRRCCSLMERLTQEISQITPTAFEHSVQIDILNQKATIDNILRNMEEIFSGPSVLVITGSLLAGLSSVRVFFLADINFLAISLIYFGLNSFVCMFVCFWVAITLTIKLRSLKKEYISKARMCNENRTDSQIDVRLFEKPNFTFIGWKLITFKTNIVLILFLIIVTLAYFFL